MVNTERPKGVAAGRYGDFVNLGFRVFRISEGMPMTVSRRIPVVSAAALISVATAIMGAPEATWADQPNEDWGTGTMRDQVRVRCDTYDGGGHNAFCRTDPVYFPGGRISIDADTDGAGNASWKLDRAGDNARACTGRFDQIAPPQSWVCDIPAGDYYLRVKGNDGSEAHGALRW